MFPEAPKHTYMSAKQILEENIESISSDEFDMDDNRDTEEQSQLSHIRNIVRKKSPKKQRRQYKLNNIDFQKRRLPELARAVNSLFNHEKKKSFKYSPALEKNLL